ncbi:hypothetical protein J6590_012809 [Homalodisca vitripennis]|nr:hypothetical protein J6590_012809 [Homalodisca vitripennis]
MDVATQICTQHKTRGNKNLQSLYQSAKEHLPAESRRISQPWRNVKNREQPEHIAGAGAGEQLVSSLVKVNQLTSTNQSNQAENQYLTEVAEAGKIKDKNKLSKLSPGSTSPTKKGATPNKTSPPLKEEPTSSGTGNGKSRTLTGNEVLSRRQTKHDPPEILRGASLGERRKEKESKTTPQGKPGRTSIQSMTRGITTEGLQMRNVGLPPQPPRYGINQLSSNWGEKTKNPQSLAACLSTAELTGWALQKTRSPTWKGLAIRPLLNFLLTLSLDCRSLTLTASQVSLTLGVPGTGRRLSRLQRLDKGSEGGQLNMTWKGVES